MTKFRLAALMCEVLSLLSLQQQLFQFVHSTMWDMEEATDITVAAHAIDCLNHRGESGKWVRDWKYIRQREGASWEASWRWHDDSGCDVVITDKAAWCKVMSDLNITHVYMVGDSTMVDFTKSLRSLLFEVGQPVEALGSPSNSPCGQLLSTSELYHIPSDINRVPPVVTEDGSGRKLVLFNIGADIQRMEEFEGNLTVFMEWIDEWRRPDDLIFFRSIVPARKVCTLSAREAGIVFPEGGKIRPSAHYSENIRGEEIEHSVNLRQNFNEYARQLSAEYRIRYLNVYNSTILQRYDHHPSTYHCEDYFHSGRVDWWVHFLYSTLLDVRKVELQATQHEFRGLG